MRLRPATLGDVSLLKSWESNAHVVAATGGGDGWDWETALARETDWCEILIAETEDGRPIGMVQILDPARDEDHYWGDVAPNQRAIDIWIGEAADLDHGMGTEMMRLALDRCFAEPSVEAVLVDPLAVNTRSHRFYERLGFARVGPRVFGADHCLVYRLERRAWLHGP